METHFYVQTYTSHIRFTAAYMSSPANPNQTTKCGQFRRQLQIAALRVLLNKALEALKETPDDYEKTFFKTTIFHGIHNHFSNSFFLRSKNQADSDFLINRLSIHLFNQNRSRDTIHEQRKTDAEVFKIEVIIVVNRTKNR